MKRILSASAKSPRLDRAELCLRLVTESSIPPPPETIITTRRALEVSRNTVDTPREPVRLKHLLGEKKGIVQLPESALKDNLPVLSSSGGKEIWTLPTMEQDEHQSERLELLSMLDRDQEIPQSRAVCSSCADTHDRSLFSSESLAQSSRERRCLGSAGCVWVCPHWIFDHNLVTTSTKPRGIHKCGNKGVSVLAFGGIHSGDPIKDATRPVVIRPIVDLRGCYNKPPSKALVEGILRRMNLSICKHYRSTDAFVSLPYSPDCLMLWGTKVGSNCECQTCVSRFAAWNASGSLNGVNCEFCGTQVWFTILPRSNGEDALSLVVMREMRTAKGCTDRAWIDGVNDPAEFERLEREWNAANNEVEVTQEEDLPA